jgi:hypothetical protein
VPYRGDETDPLEVIIRQRRATRRALLVALASMVLPTLWRLDYARLGPSLLRAPAPTAAPVQHSAPSSPPAPKGMTAADVEQQIRLDACSPGYSGWDYVCSYRSGPSLRARRLKIGVLVGPSGIVHVSLTYPIDRNLPEAPRAANSF